MKSLLSTYRVLMSLLIFELLTLETWHFYERAAAIAPTMTRQIANKRHGTEEKDDAVSQDGTAP